MFVAQRKLRPQAFTIFISLFVMFTFVLACAPATTAVPILTPLATAAPPPTNPQPATATPTQTATPTATPIPAARVKNPTTLYTGPDISDYAKIATLRLGTMVQPIGKYGDFVQVRTAINGVSQIGFVPKKSLEGVFENLPKASDVKAIPKVLIKSDNPQLFTSKSSSSVTYQTLTRIPPLADSVLEIQLSIDALQPSGGTGLLFYNGTRVINFLYVTRQGNKGNWFLTEASGGTTFTNVNIPIDDKMGRFSFRFSEDGKRITIVFPSNHEESISLSGLFDVKGELQLGVAIAPGTTATITELTLNLLPDGKIYFGDADTSKLTPLYISVDNIDQIMELRTLQVPQFTLSIAISPDSKFLATGGCAQSQGNRIFGGRAAVFDLYSGTEEFRPEVSNSCVQGIAFSPDGKLLGVGFNNEVRIYNVPKGDRVGNLELAGPTFNLAFSPDSRFIAAYGGGGGFPILRLWDTVLRKEVQDLPYNRHRFYPGQVVFSPQGDILAWSDDTGIILWDLKTSKLLRRLRPGDNNKSIVFSPDGRILYADVCIQSDQYKCSELFSTSTHIVKLDVNTGVEFNRTANLNGAYTAIGLSPDGTVLASVRYDLNAKMDVVALFNTNTGSLVHEVRLMKSTSTIMFSPNGKFLAVHHPFDSTVHFFGLR